MNLCYAKTVLNLTCLKISIHIELSGYSLFQSTLNPKPVLLQFKMKEYAIRFHAKPSNNYRSIRSNLLVYHHIEIGLDTHLYKF